MIPMSPSPFGLNHSITLITSYIGIYIAQLREEVRVDLIDHRCPQTHSHALRQHRRGQKAEEAEHPLRHKRVRLFFWNGDCNIALTGSRICNAPKTPLLTSWARSIGSTCCFGGSSTENLRRTCISPSPWAVAPPSSPRSAAPPVTYPSWSPRRTPFCRH